MGLKNRSLGALRQASFFLSDERRRHHEHLLRGILERRDLQRADAVLVSFPKAGRTWVRVMLTRALQIHLGLPEDELLVFDNFKRRDARAPSILFTHLFFAAYSPAGRARTREIMCGRPTLLLVRQPIDVAVSFHHQWRNRDKDSKRWLHGLPLGEEDVDIDRWIRHPSWGLDRVIDYYNRAGELMAEVPGSRTMRYEQLRAEPVSGLREILAFFGLEVPEAVIEGAVEHGSFARMQARERSGDLPSRGATRLAAGDPDNVDSFKARRGKIGGYTDELSPETVRWAEARVAERLAPAFGYGHPAAKASAAGDH